MLPMSDFSNSNPIVGYSVIHSAIFRCILYIFGYSVFFVILQSLEIQGISLDWQRVL